MLKVAPPARARARTPSSRSRASSRSETGFRGRAPPRSASRRYEGAAAARRPPWRCCTSSCRTTGDAWIGRPGRASTEYYATVGGAAGERARRPGLRPGARRRPTPRRPARLGAAHRAAARGARARPPRARRWPRSRSRVDDLVRGDARDAGAARAGHRGARRRRSSRLPADARRPRPQRCSPSCRACAMPSPALEGLASEAVQKIRVHGDYHLGQVLHRRRRRVRRGRLRGRARPPPGRAARQGSARSATWPACCGRSRTPRAGRAAAAPPRRGRTTAARRPPGAVGRRLGGRRPRTRSSRATWPRRASGARRFVPRRRETLDAALRAFELDKARLRARTTSSTTGRAGCACPCEALRRGRRRRGPAAAARRLRRPTEGPFRLRRLPRAARVRGRARRERAPARRAASTRCRSTRSTSTPTASCCATGSWPGSTRTTSPRGWRCTCATRCWASGWPWSIPRSFAEPRRAARGARGRHRRSPARPSSVAPRSSSAEPFDFVRSRIVEVPTGVEVTDARPSCARRCSRST